MTFALSSTAVRAGCRLAAFDSTGSTNDEALRRAAAGEGGPLWCVTTEQTAGRGRRGNAWCWITGNLAASLLLVTKADPAVIPQLGFVSGLATARALESLDPTGSVAFRLKWPNDVLANGAKLVGILLQSEPLPDGGRAVVAGIGINVVGAPQGLAYPAASLHGLGLAVDAQAVFAALSAAWVECDSLWDEGRGFEAVRREWLARAAGLGGPVTVRVGERVREGMFETIDGMGHLVIRGGDGSEHRVSAGEVHFGSARTERGAEARGVGA